VFQKLVLGCVKAPGPTFETLSVYDTASAYSLGLNANLLDGGEVDEEELLDILPDWVGPDSVF
jgi:hypothetical protein